MKNRIIVVRHGDDPPDDRIYSYLVGAGYTVDLRKPFAGENVPPIGSDGSIEPDIAGTVIHGGKYNAYDIEKHPFLKDEYRWIAASLQADIPMLGICQGCQQIAWHLGAFAGAGDDGVYEFGYYEVRPTAQADGFLDDPLIVTQSHFHTFGIPQGATPLATSDRFANQAFRYGDKVYGFQFHPEVTIEGFRRWQNADWAPYGEPGAQTRREQTSLMMKHDDAQARWFYAFLEKLFVPVV
ncbi:MAG: glutamine amidotransferase [Pseudomonadota bacterium]